MKLKFQFQFLFALLGSVLAATFRQPDTIALGNAVLTHPGPCDSKLADEAIGRHQLVKFGSDADHIGVADDADIPLGFTRDASGAIGELVGFDLLGLSHKATEFTADGAVTAGNYVCPGDGGKVRDITLLNGVTVYICGRALTTGADAAQVIVVPFAPVQRVIA